MAEVEKAIAEILLADAGVTAITTVINPDNTPQDEDLPAIVFGRMSTDGDPHMGGATDLIEARMWIESHAIDTDTQGGSVAAWELATAVRKALDVKHGTFGGIVVQLIWRNDEGAHSLIEKEGSDKYEHVVTQEFGIAALESVA